MNQYTVQREGITKLITADSINDAVRKYVKSTFDSQNDIIVTQFSNYNENNIAEISKIKICNVYDGLIIWKDGETYYV